MPRKLSKKNVAGKIPRRSSCPVACSLDIIGDRWTLLIVRDLVLGRSRYRDFVRAPEGVPTNVLSNRLERLLHDGIVEHMPAEDGTQRLAYRLTHKGEALKPLLRNLRDWGLKWISGTEAVLKSR